MFAITHISKAGTMPAGVQLCVTSTAQLPWLPTRADRDRSASKPLLPHFMVSLAEAFLTVVKDVMFMLLPAKRSLSLKGEQ